MSEDNIPFSWHVAQTEPFAGLLAERELQRKKIDIGAEWNVFHPRVRITQRWSRGRTRTVTRPYIAGYMFVQFDTSHPEWPRINWTVGLKELMYSDAEKPARIPDKAMDFLLNLCETEKDEFGNTVHYLKEQTADEALFEVGRTIRWKPSWMDAPVERQIVWTGGDRLRVLMDIFGHTREIELRKKAVTLV